MVLEFLSDLKSKVGSDDYEILIAMAREDIKFNMVSFNRKITPGQFIEVCKMCQLTLSRCNGGVRA